MNPDHGWMLGLPTVLRKQQIQVSALKRLADRNHRFVELSLREATRGLYLVKLIRRRVDLMKKLKDCTSQKENTKLLKNLKFNNEFLKRYLFTFDPPLVFGPQDFLNDHLDNCSQCKEYVDKLHVKRIISPDLHEVGAEDIPQQFATLFSELIIEYILLVGEELSEFALLT